MHKVMLWIQGVLVPALGPFGLFVVAVADSSFISIPEVNDLLVVSSSAAYPRQAWLYILMATLGSLAGCAMLWWIGRRGGEALLERRFGVERVAKTKAAFTRWGVLALAIPSMLPPPMPFKVFVLSSGVFGMAWPRFMTTLIVARGLRYTFWGTLGALYGTKALELLRHFDAWFAQRIDEVLAVLGSLILVCLAFWAMRRRKPTPAGPAA